MWSRTFLRTRLFNCCGQVATFKRIKMKTETYCRGFRSSSALSLWENFNFDLKKQIAGKFEKTEGGSSTLHDDRSVLDRYIFMKTLTNYYEDWIEGIILDTSYADSQPNADWSPSIPVVVALHDTPGCHSDLVPILNTFAKLGCRVIAPSFPGHGHTQGLMAAHDDIFAHSTMERAVFVQDFLSNLGIERVDLIIGFGAASYTVLYLVSSISDQSYYRSFSLISPWPLSRPRYDHECKVSKRIQSLWDRPMIRTPVTLGLQSVSLGSGKTAREKVNTAYVINNLDLAEAGGSAMALGATKIPRSVIFGGKDSEMNREEYRSLCEELNIPEKNITEFRGNRIIAPLLPGALMFPEGGYELQDQHAGAISLYLLHIVGLFHPQVKSF